MEIRSTISSTFYSPQPSTSARAGAAEAGGAAVTDATAPAGANGVSGAAPEDAGTAAPAGSTTELSEDELAEVQTLKSRDTEVRTHEQAHMAAGGRYITSGASYEYQTGPDGQDYAVGGEVGIDTSPVSGDPAATIAKARTLMRAALAPADPSAQDQRVAAAAESMESTALQDLVELQQGERISASAPAADASSDQTSGQGATSDGANAHRGSTSTSTEPSERLERRIAGFFAAQVQHAISQFA